MNAEKLRILLIEDDQTYSRMLLKRLSREGYATLSTATGRAGLIMAEARRPDLILLNLKLPDTDGVQLHSTLRNNPKTSAIPIIIVTGLDMLPRVMDSVSDNLHSEPLFCKDRGLKSLMQLIRAAIRPPEQALPLAMETHGRILRKGALSVDLKTRQCIFEGKSFPPLAPTRFNLLCALMRHDGPVSREEIMMEIWGDRHDPKVVDVTIARLRRDIRRVKHISIQTMRHGYALIVGESRSVSFP